MKRNKAIINTVCTHGQQILKTKLSMQVNLIIASLLACKEIIGYARYLIRSVV